MLAIILAAVFYNGVSDWKDTPCSGHLNDMTWTIQVAVTNLATEAPQGRVAYVEEYSNTSYIYAGLSPDGSVECSARTGSTQAYARGAAVLDLNTRQVLTCVSDGTVLSAYLNGLPRAQAILTGISGATRDMCTYGALRRNNPPAFSCYWHGDIEEPVRTWDHALSPAEVLAESGVEQPPDQGEEPAHGHTLLVWTPPPYVPDVEASLSFQVQRQVYLPTSVSSWSDVWNSSICNRQAFTDDDGIQHPPYLCDYFPLLMAPSVPREGVRYEYRVRTLGVDGNVSAWTDPFLMEPQDPTKCYEIVTPADPRGIEEIACP